MKMKNLFFVFVLTITALMQEAASMQCLGLKESYEHRDALVSLNAQQLYRMGAEFCEHEQLISLPLLTPGYELILSVSDEENTERLFHIWQLEKNETAVPCDQNYKVQYYYLADKFIKHEFEISEKRKTIDEARKNSYWHNIFKDQISEAGFEFIEMVVINIAGVTYYHRLDNLNLRKLIDNISLNLFGALIMEPMLDEIDVKINIMHSIDSQFPVINIAGNTYKDSLRPGSCMRHCASCLADSIFMMAAFTSKQPDFAPMKNPDVLGCFKSIDLSHFNQSPHLNAELVQKIINYYLDKLNMLSPKAYEKYKQTEVKTFGFN